MRSDPSSAERLVEGVHFDTTVFIVTAEGGGGGGVGGDISFDINSTVKDVSGISIAGCSP